MDEPYLVVSLLSDDGSKIGFNAPTQSASFIFVSHDNLIERVFTDLQVLYCHSPYRVSASHLIGNLLSSKSSESRFCGSILPARLIEPLSFLSLEVELIRNFVELCCVVYNDIECFEADAEGNYFPLDRYQSRPVVQSQSPVESNNFIRDVTDAFRRKLLELRICQENGEDSRHIVKSIQDIWRNTRLLWDLSETGDEDSLNERWRNIGLVRSSHKKQVKHDAKLVLSTRLCLEQGVRRGTSSHVQQSPSAVMRARDSPIHSPGSALRSTVRTSSHEALRTTHAVEIWTAALLAEMFGVSALISVTMIYMHGLLCPGSCYDKRSQQRLLSALNLSAQLRVESLMDDDRECQQLAQRLYIHFHKYSIPVDRLLQPSRTSTSSNITPHSREFRHSSDSSDRVVQSLRQSPELHASVSSPGGAHGGRNFPANLDDHPQSSLRYSRSPRHSSLKRHPTSSRTPSADDYESDKSSSSTSSISDSKSLSSRALHPPHPTGGRNNHRKPHDTSYNDHPNRIPRHSPKGRQSPEKGNHHDVSLDTMPSLSHYALPSPHPYSPHDAITVVDSNKLSPILPATKPLHAHMGDSKLTVLDLTDGCRASGPSVGDRTPKKMSKKKHSRGSSTGGSTSGSDRSSRKSERFLSRRSSHSPSGTSQELYDANGHRIRHKNSTNSKSLGSANWRKEQQRHRKKGLTGNRSPENDHGRSRSSSRGYHSTGSMDSERGGKLSANGQSVAFGRRETNAKREPKSSREILASTALASSALNALRMETDKQKHFDPEEGRHRALSRLAEKKLAADSEKEKLALEAALRAERLKAVELRAEMARLNHPSPPSGILTQPRPHSAPTTRSPFRRVSPNTKQPSKSPVSQISNFDSTEARRRAATRVRERREKMVQDMKKQHRLAVKKEQEKWSRRDKKIEEFLSRQQQSASFILSSRDNSPATNGLAVSEDYSPPASPQHGRLDGDRSLSQTPQEQRLDSSAEVYTGSDLSPVAYINWDADQVRNSSFPADAVIHEASEVSSMIDDALGMIASPQYSSSFQKSSSSTIQNRFESPVAAIASSGGRAAPTPPSAGAYTPTRMPSDMLCIKVLRVSFVPDTLGGPNPYVVFNWGSLGKAATHAVQNSANPVFNSTLRFRSPASQGSSLSEALMKSPPLELLLYSRHDSISDELLGRAIVTDTSNLHPDDEGVFQVVLSPDDNLQGRRRDLPVVEFEVQIV